MSSLSIREIYAHLDIFIPIFLVFETHKFLTFLTGIILLSFFVYSSIISHVLSTLPSSMMINSKLIKDCVNIDSIASAIYNSALYAGISTETKGSDMIIFIKLFIKIPHFRNNVDWPLSCFIINSANILSEYPHKDKLKSHKSKHSYS